MGTRGMRWVQGGYGVQGEYEVDMRWARGAKAGYEGHKVCTRGMRWVRGNMRWIRG